MRQLSAVGRAPLGRERLREVRRSRAVVLHLFDSGRGSKDSIGKKVDDRMKSSMQ